MGMTEVRGDVLAQTTSPAFEREREAVVITRIEKLVNGQSSTEEKWELSSANRDFGCRG